MIIREKASRRCVECGKSKSGCLPAVKLIDNVILEACPKCWAVMHYDEHIRGLETYGYLRQNF